MSASVSYNCSYCAQVKKCKDKPKDLYKVLKGNDRMCFESQKSLDNLQSYSYRGKKVGKKPKQEEETEDGNV